MAEYKWDPLQYFTRGADKEAAKRLALADRAAAMKKWRREGFRVEVWTIPAEQTTVIGLGVPLEYTRSVYCLTVT